MAELDLGRAGPWPWPRDDPLLLTSGPLASVEMTHVVGRHFFSEYGVFTRFLILSPVPGAPSGCAKPSPGRQEGFRDRYPMATCYNPVLCIASLPVAHIQTVNHEDFWTVPQGFICYYHYLLLIIY